MSKKIVQEYLKKGDKINAKIVFDDGKTFKVEFVGEIKSMSNNNSGGFSNKQLEQLSSLMDFKLKPITERLDNIEKDVKILKEDVKVLKEDVKLMKDTPTMQKELNNKY